MATNNVLAKLAVNISANTAQFNQALNRTHNRLNTFTTGLKNLAGTLGLVFSVQQVASFTLEVSKLAGEAEGVRAAFERLPNNIKLMNDLKQATGGTVSELDLMKRAVQAANFDISLGALPRLLEFATLRAQQTGQSVDYLVDSIVTGIGRKSKLILDNLGISAVQLTEALGGASAAASSIGDVADAVGKIAEDNLKNMAGFSENAATKLQRLAATWENVKVAIGEAGNSTGILGGAIDGITKALDVLASKDLSFLEKLGAFAGSFVAGSPGLIGLASTTAQARAQERLNKEQEKQAQVIREVDRAFAEFNGNIDAYGRAISTHIYRTELLAEFTRRLTEERKKTVEVTKALQKVEEATPSLSLTAQRAMSGTGMSQTANMGGFGFMPVDTDAAISKMEAFRSANAEVTESVSQNWMDLSGIVGGAVISLAESLGSAIAGTQDFGSAVLQAVAGFAKEFGSMLIASGIAALALESLLSNPLAAIAAGAALVAIAGAASASLSRSHSAMSGGNSGRRSSETSIKIGGRIRGYDLALVGEKERYRRGRVG